MDYQDMHTEGYSGTTFKQPPNNMATASLVLGIIALITSCCYYTALPLSGLSILFGLLSRPEGKFSTPAKAGMILSAIALVMLVLSWVLLFAWFADLVGGPAVRNMPVVPSLPEMTPGLDNILTVFWGISTGGAR